MLKNIFTTSATRLQEEMLYEVVAEEMENKVRRPGLWAKAFAMSNGNENAAKAKYILLRVQSLRDEIEEQSKELQAQQLVQTQHETESNLRAQTKTQTKTQTKETYPFPSDKDMQHIKQDCKTEDHISLIKFIHQFGYRVTISEPYGKSLDQTFSVQLPTGKRTSIKGKFSFISFVKREILSSK